MSIENEITRSETMSYEEITRYELPVSFNKLNEIVNSLSIESDCETISHLESEIEDIQFELSTAEGVIDELTEEVKLLKEELENVRNIQK